MNALVVALVVLGSGDSSRSRRRPRTSSNRPFVLMVLSSLRDDEIRDQSATCRRRCRNSHYGPRCRLRLGLHAAPRCDARRRRRSTGCGVRGPNRVRCPYRDRVAGSRRRGPHDGRGSTSRARRVQGSGPRAAFCLRLFADLVGWGLIRGLPLHDRRQPHRDGDRNLRRLNRRLPELAHGGTRLHWHNHPAAHSPRALVWDIGSIRRRDGPSHAVSATSNALGRNGRTFDRAA